MGTRARVGIVEPDGSVTSIYTHWDGYPDHHAPMLLEHYATEERVRALLALGDISVLDRELGEKIDFDDYRAREVRHQCLAYGRDRGETGIEARSDPSLPHYVNREAFRSDAEYVYAFSVERQAWMCWSAPWEGGVEEDGLPGPATQAVLNEHRVNLTPFVERVAQARQDAFLDDHVKVIHVP